MDAEKLNAILEKHGKWVRGEDGGERANLAGADLARANLAGADLARADLTWANLARANLARADLARANLAGANLTEANLAGANLTWANLIVIHPGPWEMIVSKTHIHIGCERFPNDKSAQKTMRELAGEHGAIAYLQLYLAALDAANKLMRLGAAAAKKGKQVCL